MAGANSTDPTHLCEALSRGDRATLARLLTWAESKRAEHRRLVDEVIAACPVKGSYSVAVTGAPGVGKSTLLESLGMKLVDRGARVAVLSIDPTSPVSGGSLLGDKTRMAKLSAHPGAFIRPAPSGEGVGGVSAHTYRCLRLFEAAGYEVVFLETVGVGQSEVDAWALCDALLVLLDPAAGDELQGMKRGLMEHVDVLAITKGSRDPHAAEQTRLAYQSALSVLRGRAAPATAVIDGLSGEGVEALWEELEAFRRKAEFEQSREARHQARREASFWRALEQGVREQIRGRSLEEPDGDVGRVMAAFRAGTGSPAEAAERLLEIFFSTDRSDRSK